jgi:hypothetical protein
MNFNSFCFSQEKKLKDAKALGRKMADREWHKDHYDEFQRLSQNDYQRKRRKRLRQITLENVPAQSAPAVPLQSPSVNHPR